MNATPLSDRVIVIPLESPGVTTGGIIIPDTAKGRPMRGRVISVGLGRYTEKGILVPMSVKVGDEILFPTYVWEDVTIDGEELYIIKEEKILAILNK